MTEIQLLPRCDVCGVEYVEGYEGPCGEFDLSGRCPGKVSWRATAEALHERLTPSASADRAGVGRDDNLSRDPRLQRAYEREWKRHPAQIELLQTIVLKLDRIIELLEAPDA